MKMPILSAGIIPLVYIFLLLPHASQPPNWQHVFHVPLSPSLKPVYTRTGQSWDRATAQSRLPYMVKWAGLDDGRSSLEREAFDRVSERQ